MVEVYTTAATRRFRLPSTLRNVSYISGSLSSRTLWRQDAVRVHSELHVARQGAACRVHLGFVADTLCDAIPGEGWEGVLQAYQTVRSELFARVATAELLQALDAACYARNEFAARLTHLPQREGDLSLGMYVDLSRDELPQQPIPSLLRNVLRYSPRTFPVATIVIRYEL